MASVGRWKPELARVMRARVQSVEDDALDCAAMAKASATLIAPLPREEAAVLAWSFIRSEIEYQEETGDQFIRSPWYTLAEGVADCKSTAVFIAAICAAAGCSVVLRYIVHPGESDFGHVFAVVDGRPVDPLLPFGEAFPSIHAEDIAIN